MKLRKLLLIPLFLAAISLRAQVAPIQATLNTVSTGACSPTSCLAYTIPSGVGSAGISIVGSSGTVVFEVFDMNGNYAPVNVTPSNSGTDVSSATVSGTQFFQASHIAGQYGFRVRLTASGSAAVTINPSTAPPGGGGGGGGGGGSVTQGTTPWVVSCSANTNCPVNASQVGAPWSFNDTQLNGVNLGSPSNYGTSPGSVSVQGVNAFITNSPTVVGGAASGSAVSGNPVLVAGANAGNAETIATDASGRQISVGAAANAAAVAGNPVLVAGSSTPGGTGNAATLYVGASAGNISVSPSNTSAASFETSYPTSFVATTASGPGGGASVLGVENFGVDPCQASGVPKKSVPINITSGTTTSLVATSGTTVIYPCGASLTISEVVTTANTFQLEYGTGAACVTTQSVQTGLYGAGGVTAGDPIVISIPEIGPSAAGAALCAVTAIGSSGSFQGVLTYVQQ